MASIDRKVIKESVNESLAKAVKMIEVKSIEGAESADVLELWKNVKYSAETMLGILAVREMDLAKLLCALTQLSEIETKAIEATRY